MEAEILDLIWVSVVIIFTQILDCYSMPSYHKCATDASLTTSPYENE